MDLMQIVPAIKGLVVEEGFKFEYDHKDYSIVIFSLNADWYEINIDIEKRNNNEQRVLLYLGKMERTWNEEDEEENKVKEVCRVDIHDSDSLAKVREILARIAKGETPIKDDPAETVTADATVETETAT